MRRATCTSCARSGQPPSASGHTVRLVPLPTGLALVCVVVLTLIGVPPQSVALQLHEERRADVEVRITSPQGRLASSGPIRIVARATAPEGARIAKVSFFVGDAAVGEDTEGPLYAVEWVDENPFDEIRIRALATTDAGTVAEHVVTLPAMDVSDETSVSSVLLDVAVLAADGRHVSGLTREHFALRENDRLQSIDLVEPSRTPTTITLLVDTSRSMSSRFEFVRRATRRLSALLRPEDRLAVVPFSRVLGALTGPTRDLEALSSAIEGLATSGGTAIADALAELATRLADAQGRQIVVLITDGYDEHSRHDMDAALAAVKRVNATLYGIGIGGVAGISFRGREALERISEQTGGKAFFPSRDAELPLVQEHIHDDVAHRYLLSYTPSDQARDGKWRSIVLRTGNPDHLIRTREGYFAPTPLPVRPTLEFTITSRARSALTIGKDDLEAVEDGTVQAIDTFHEAVAPVSILLALDGSGSMRQAVEDVKAAAASFIGAVRDEDRLGIVLFSDTATLATDLTRSRLAPQMTIDGYHARGGTALYDAIRVGLDRLDTVEGRRVIVVLTDGRDEDGPGTGPGSRSTLDELLARLRDVDAAVFTVGLGAKVDRDVLERLARESGGLSYFPASASELPEQYATIIEDLRRRYVISYQSTNSTRDGRWRTVHLRPTRPDIHVFSRGGYRAPDR